jgi:dTDP-4-amino-4,6-dideoxygalactose transaminase
MNKSFLPFALPDIGEEEMNEVLDSLRSGWLTTGPKTKRFEEEFANFIGNDVEAIAINSATSGLHLALEATGIKPGDEVIVPVHTFTATAEVIRYLGADPVFIDVDEKTLNIDTDLIEKTIRSCFKEKGFFPKAIIPVHFGGLSCNMSKIVYIAKKYGLKIIEDAAHALPTTFNGKLIGGLDTDATVFSFYATKTITTGEGGMIVTRNKTLANRCRTMRLHGISKDVFNRYTSNKPSWYYEVIAPGYKYNMSDIAASIGIHQLKKVWDFQKKRSAMAALYDNAFSDLPLILPSQAIKGEYHAWHLYPIRLKDEVSITRNHFIELMAKKGIGCSVHFIPLHLHPYWRDRYNLKSEDFPESLHAFQQTISLPIYTLMTPSDQLKVINSVRTIVGTNNNTNKFIPKRDGSIKTNQF